jgi:DNA-binding response OmpR family regulator
MSASGRSVKILLIDTNVYFSKRLSDALKREGFEVTCSTQPAFALTTLEYDAPSAIVCSTNMREMGALDIARMIRADVKNSAMPIIALGDGGQRALMEAFQAGCDDYIDRARPPAVIATHVKNIIVSKAEGFQPTQMLTQSDTSLSGSLTHHDLPGVMQMLGHAHQTGALHINSGETDALLFFDAGAIAHAECGSLFGDEAVIHILKNCFHNNSGVYKFVYGSASTQRTVLRSATDLMIDAMREVDESSRDDADLQPAELALVQEQSSVLQQTDGTEAAHSDDFAAAAKTVEASTVVNEEERPSVPQEADLAAITRSNEDSSAAQTADHSAVPGDEEQLAGAAQFDVSVPAHQDDFSAIKDALDRFASTHSNDYSVAAEATDNPDIATSLDNAAEPYTFNQAADAPVTAESTPPSPVENSEISAADDQSLATRPEEVL